MSSWVSGGVVEGTLPKEPERPAGIPQNYVFDREVELWMPPSAVASGKPQANVSGAASTATGITILASSQIPNSGPAPSQSAADSDPNQPICFEYTNTGSCSRLSRGEACRYRHLEATHPEVVRDRVRQGKLPAAALDAALAGDTAALQALMSNPKSTSGLIEQSLSEGMLEEDLPDPGPGAQLCFDYINNQKCSRLRSGQTCKYRHLPHTHPDVLADRIRTGKLTPQQAVAALHLAQDSSLDAKQGAAQAAAGAGAVGGAASSLPLSPAMAAALAAGGGGAAGGAAAAAAAASVPACGAAGAVGGGLVDPFAPAAPGSCLIPPAAMGGMLPGLVGAPGSVAGLLPGGIPSQMGGIPSQMGGVPPMLPPTLPGMHALPLAPPAMGAGGLPDPGPSHQLCFDYINRGICSRLSRGESCRYRHLHPNHPDVIADKIRSGKMPANHAAAQAMSISTIQAQAQAQA